MTQQAELPKFGRPPVAEVALSVMIEPLGELKAAHVGLLWSEMRTRFPKSSDQPPLDSVEEQETEQRRAFGPAIQFEPVATPRWRTWFLNDDETELLQFQHDRIARNWRRLDTTGPYPRYDSIRTPFQDDLALVQRFLESNKIGELKPKQCEVTYVNHIPAGSGWQSHHEVGAVLRNWSHQGGSFLPEIEDAKLAWRYQIRHGKGFIGRLHVSFQPAYRSSNGSEIPLFVLTLTARGKPLGIGLEGALKFLDTGHEWIVRGFADLTTANMHQVWQRQS